MKYYSVTIAIILLFIGWTGCSKPTEYGKYKKYAIRFADSEMVRFPEAWQLDHGKRFVWGYAQGLGALTMLKMWKATNDEKYYDYIHQWADHMVQEDGSIYDYKVEKYNIDFINAGKILFDMYDQTQENKYRMAMDTLMKQLRDHPKTSEGVYWHKLIYPHQIWLDGIYMAGPFMAHYGERYQRPELIDLAMHEIVVTAQRTRDSATGLYYHAYDESREQLWADKESGQSPNFWGRGMGWFFMAMVDILDFVPNDHPRRMEVIEIINDMAAAVIRYQDETGLWYQVMDQGGREKNYLEASVSSMFMYSIAKSINKGYIPDSYKQVAFKIFDGITTVLIEEQENGVLSLTQCCAVSGLGGRPYRDGSYEYYVNERIRDNDSKATGPFIMGCLELDILNGGKN